MITNNFYELYETNDNMKNDNFSFLYWRQSPRGSTKFGITHLPWERLRMQQQGTDEEIQFDHMWMTRHWAPGYTKVLEEKLKKIYKPKCLANTTKRAGHTEWYNGVSLKDFEENLAKITEGLNGGTVVKVPLNGPYKATKSSQCPFGSPSNSRHQDKTVINEWQQKFWSKLSVL